MATVLLAVALAGDAFLIGLAPSLAPARAPEVIEREASMEKVVVEVEKEVVVDKKVVVEAPVEAPALESQPAYATTPSPVPAEDMGELVRAPKPLPTPGVAAQEMEAEGAPPVVEKEALAEAPPGPGEERIEATAMPTPLPADAIATAEPAFTPTAVAEVLPPTPLPQEPTVRAAARPSRLVLLRVAEAGLLALVLVLAIATLVARRRQGAR